MVARLPGRLVVARERAVESLVVAPVARGRTLAIMAARWAPRLPRRVVDRVAVVLLVPAGVVPEVAPAVVAPVRVLLSVAVAPVEFGKIGWLALCWA